MTQPPKTIHYSQLPPPRPNDPPEVLTFHRVLGDLIAQGHEGKWILIKGDQVADFFDSDDAATSEGYRRYGLTGFNVYQVATYQPLIRCNIMWYYQCPTPTTR